MGGGTDADTVSSTRTRRGHREVVQLSAHASSRTLFDQGAGDVRRCLTTGSCGTIPRSFTPAPVGDLPSGSTGFASVYRSKGTVTRSFQRSSTFVDGPPGADDRLVMVSLLRTDGSSPSPADLRSLTKRQVAEVEAWVAKHS